MCIFQKDTRDFSRTVDKLEELEVANDFKETVFSRLGVEITHMTSHWLGQHAQDLCKINPDKVAWKGDGHPYLRSYLQLRKPVFFTGADPSGLTTHK